MGIDLTIEGLMDATGFNLTLLSKVLDELEGEGKVAKDGDGSPRDPLIWALTHAGFIEATQKSKPKGIDIQGPESLSEIHPPPNNQAEKATPDILPPPGPIEPRRVTTELLPEEPQTSVSANPQPGDGHIHITNDIARALTKVNLSPYESRILWTILYKGDGHISLRELGRITGLHFANVKRSLAKLKAKNIIARKDYKGIPGYRFEKDSKKWRAVVKRDYTELRFEDKKITSVV